MPNEERLSKREFYERMEALGDQIRDRYMARWKEYAAEIASGAEHAEESYQYFGRLAADYMVSVLDAVYDE